MTNSFKRQLLLAFIVLTSGVLLVWAYSQWDQSQSTKNRNNLYVELLERSGQLNRDLPKLLDEGTRFERAEVVNYGMRFIYKLVRVNRHRHHVEDIQSQLEASMLRHYCQHDSLAYYRNQADFVEFQYLDMNEAKLFVLRFEPADCG